MAYKARRERKRGGGVKAKVQEYDAQGSNEMRESSDRSDGFREGGKVEGKEGRKHMGKRARGGGVRGMRGGAPFSSGKSLTGRSEMGEKTGPGEQAPIED